MASKIVLRGSTGCKLSLIESLNTNGFWQKVNNLPAAEREWYRVAFSKLA